MNQENVKEMLAWAMRNRAEDCFEEKYYYWTPQAKKIFNKLTILEEKYGNRLLIGVIGASGVGKSALVRALESRLFSWHKEHFKDYYYETPVLRLKWKQEFSRGVSIKDENGNTILWLQHSVLIDTPDYAAKDIRKISKDLDGIHNVWADVRRTPLTYCGTNFVIFFQKELVKRADHFFLRKMDKVDLNPLKPDELLEAFHLRFATDEPFTLESLTLIADLSRGIFRRFMRYIQLSLEDMIERASGEVTVADVHRVISDEVLMQDLELEFSDIFKNERYMRHAVGIVNLLQEVKEVNQETLAQELNVHPSILGKIVATLEENGYVKRMRGKGKTWRVEMQ
jgi:hypothetical protein